MQSLDHIKPQILFLPTIRNEKEHQQEIYKQSFYAKGASIINLFKNMHFEILGKL